MGRGCSTRRRRQTPPKDSNKDEVKPDLSNTQFQPDVKTDLQKLHGAWTLVEMESRGEKLTGKDMIYPFDSGNFAIKSLKLVIDGKETPKLRKIPADQVKDANDRLGGVEIQFNDSKPEKGDFRLNETKNPKNITMAWMFMYWESIYKVEGDTLTICFNPKTCIRPDEFRTTADSDRVILVFKRDKPKKDAELPAGVKQPAADPEPPDADSRKLLGDWDLVSFGSEGKEGPVNGWTMNVEKERMTMSFENERKTSAWKIDPQKTPKHIDMPASFHGSACLYKLDKDELTIACSWARRGSERPKDFASADVTLVFKRRKTEQKVLTPGEAIKQRPKEKVTVQFKVTKAQSFQISGPTVVGKVAESSGEGCYLQDGDSFYVQLRPPVMDTFRRLGIEPDKHFKGKVVRVTGRLQPGPSPYQPDELQIMVSDLSQIEVVGEAPAPATPAGKASPKDSKTEQKVLTPAEAIKQRPKENVNVQFKVTKAQSFRIVGTSREVCELQDGDSFYVQVLPTVMDTLRRLGIDPEKHFKGKMVQVTGRLQPGPSPYQLDELQIMVNDLTQIEVVKDAPAPATPAEKTSLQPEVKPKKEKEQNAPVQGDQPKAAPAADEPAAEGKKHEYALDKLPKAVKIMAGDSIVVTHTINPADVEEIKGKSNNKAVTVKGGVGNGAVQITITSEKKGKAKEGWKIHQVNGRVDGREELEVEFE